MKKAILGVLLLSVACLIFMNSAKNAEVSSDMSGRVIDFLFNNWGIELSQFEVRKTAHFCIYAVLSGLLYAVISCFIKSGKAAVTASLILAGLYAATDELHQYFVPGRSCELRDWCIDLCGAVLGITIAWMIKKNR